MITYHVTLYLRLSLALAVAAALQGCAVSRTFERWAAEIRRGMSATPPQKTAPAVITDVRTVSSPDSTAVKVSASAAFEYISYRLSDPIRLAIEIPAAKSSLSASGIVVNDDIVDAIQVINFEKAGAVRLDIGLKTPVSYEMSIDKGVLTVTMKPLRDPALADAMEKLYAARDRIEKQKSIILAMEQEQAALREKTDEDKKSIAALEARLAVVSRENEALKESLESRDMEEKKKADDAATEAEVRDTVASWLGAWRGGDLQTYAAHYAESFTGDGAGRDDWLDKKRATFGRAGDIRIELENIRVTAAGGAAEAVFIQRYSSEIHSDVGEKTLKMIKTGDGWKIESETWRPAR